MQLRFRLATSHFVSPLLVLLAVGGSSACGSEDGATGETGAGGFAQGGTQNPSAGTAGSTSAGSSGTGSGSGGISGSSGVGGSSAGSGNSSTGGSATGGSTAAGGTSGTGGTAAGGSSATGGSSAAGGTSGTGGTAAGGSPATGGAGGSIAGSGGSGGTPPMGPTGDTDVAGLIGFATVEGYGVTTTVGAGNDASIVTVSNYADLVAAVADATPRIVQISGRITGSGPMVDVGSNKTILGVGADATIDGFGFDINGWTPREVEQFGTDVCNPENIDQFPRVSNVIVRNLTFVNTSDDSINVQCYSHHVWIDHNSFNVSNDGSVDVKRGSDLVTVSFNHFISTDKTMLLGHSADNGEQDRGFLRVTYHHNWFDNTATRTPRVRFGYAHVLNNYLNSTDYFLGLGVEAQIYAEGNFVEKAKTLTQTFTESTGYHLTWASSNIYDPATITRANDSGSTMTDWLDADGSVAAPSAYQYTVEAASAVQTSVKNGAGAGKL
jgi:pectate lyase